MAGDERSTALILRSLRNTSRVFGNSAARRAIDMEREGKGIAEIGPVVAGAKGRVVYETGDTGARHLVRRHQHGALIDDIPSCRELVERIVAEAEAIIGGRLAGMVG